MQSSLVREDLKISFVGLSGTGKSLSRRVIQKSLGMKGLSSGDFMRDHVRCKYGVDLDKFTGDIVADDDREVDERAISWLKEPGPKAIDSRATGAFLILMEEKGILPAGSTLRIFVDCDPYIRAERALKKFRKKAGLEHISISGVKDLQAKRDESDEKRIIEVWKNDYGIQCKDDLYGFPRPNQMKIDTAEMSPQKVLFDVLTQLNTLSQLPFSSLPMAFKNGLIAISEEMKSSNG